MRTKAILSVFLGTVLLLSFGIGLKNAQADAILFPWVIKSDTVSTIITVINTGGNDSEGESDNFELHYQYFYKQTTENQPTEKCATYGFYRGTSKNDVVSFDASGNSYLNDGKPLYNDYSPYSGEHFDLQGVENPRRAFLIVDNNTAELVELGENREGTLYGEALVFEVATGMIWGYTAYNAKGGGVVEKPYIDIFFNDGLDSQGEVIGRLEKGITVFSPPNEFITRYYITPIGLHGQRVGDASTTIQFVLENGIGGMYDNNENPIYFNTKQNIVCTGTADLNDMMPLAVYNQLIESGMQGWAYIKTEKVTDTENPTDEAAIGKLEFSIASDVFTGSYADFTWIKNNDSIPCKACWNECMNKCKLPTVTPGFIFDKKCYAKCTKKCSAICNLLSN